MADSKNIDSLSIQNFFDQLGKIEHTVGSDEWRAQQEEKRLNWLCSCDRCRNKLKFRELQSLHVPWHAKHYCADCFPKVKRRFTYTCDNCGEEYLYRQDRNLCDKCRIYDRKAQSEVIQRHKRKSKREGLPADLTLEEWLRTIKHFDGKCTYCQEQPYQELDHFNPRGGTTRKNCVPACYACNHDKGNFNPANPPVEWGTNYINWFLVDYQTPNMSVPLFEQIKRVAAYLKVPFPYEYSFEREDATFRQLFAKFESSQKSLKIRLF